MLGNPGRCLTFVLSTASQPVLGTTQPRIQSIPEAVFLGLKRPEQKLDHSAPSSAGFKNERSYTSFPPYAFMARIRSYPLPLQIMKPH